MAKQPFLGVPGGEVRVENPDGVFLRGVNNHNLYDTQPPLAQPAIPGDYEVNREIGNPKGHG